MKKPKFPFKKITEWTATQRDQIKEVAEAEGDTDHGVLRRAWREFYARWSELRNKENTK